MKICMLRRSSKSLLLMMGIFLFFLPSFVNAQSGITLDLVGRFPYGQSQCATLDSNNIAYIGTGSSIDIVDMNTPSSPITLSNVMIKAAPVEIVVSGSKLYAAMGRDGVAIIDIADLNNPVLLNEFVPLNNCIKLLIDQNILYVAGENLSINFVENTQDPIELSSLTLANSVSSITKKDGNLFVSTEGSLKVYDVTDPGNPVQNGPVLWDFGWATNMIIRGDLVYTSSNLKTLGILNIADPGNPIIVKQPVNGPGWQLMVEYQDYLISDPIDSDLTVYSLVNPEMPQPIGNFSVLWTGLIMIANDSFVIVMAKPNAQLNTIQYIALDLSTPSAPQQIGNYELFHQGYQPRLFGDTFALLGLDSRVIDLRNPSAPIDYGSLLFEGEILRGEFIEHRQKEYFVGQTSSSPTSVFDLSNPISPQKMTALSIGDFEFGNIFEDTLYAVINRKLMTFDITNIEIPVKLDSITLPGNYTKAFLIHQDNVLLDQAFTTLEKILVVDILSANNLSLVHWPFDINARSWFSTGDHIYTTWSNNLQILEVEPPAGPVLVNDFNIEGGAYEISQYNNYLGLISNNDNFLIYDISTSLYPQQVGFTPLSEIFPISESWNFSTFNHSLCIASIANNGYYIFKFDSSSVTGLGDNTDAASLDHPRNFTLYKNYPNPFNPTTQIDYELNEPATIELAVYDVAGRRIKVLAVGNQVAGSYTTEWDGNNDLGVAVGSGVYFLRLSADNVQQVRKMLLVR